MTAEKGSYERQVRAVSALLRSSQWDSMSNMERLRLLFRAEDLAVDPVPYRAIGWDCSELEARIRLTWWLAKIQRTLLDWRYRKAS